MGNISILLADDSITIQKVAGLIFAGDDYTLTVVDNGAAAIQKAQEILPDVLLIDVLMPGMDGYEVCEKLRAIPALASKPILLLSGSFETFDEAKAKSCGADGHITKPFESQQIIAKVQELYELGQRRASGEQAAPVVETPPAFAEPAPFVEPTSFAAPAEPAEAEESFAFESNAVDTSAMFETTAPSPASEQQPPAASVDDPWGAFTAQPAAEQETPLTFGVSESATRETELDQPDVMTLVSEEPQTQATSPTLDSNIGASWVPVEEQTFEFQEEVAEPPSAVIEEPQPVVVPQEEPAPAVAPVAAAAGAITLTDEQLKQALMSVSQETIERIVWEVVPDLAESLIKEAIRRITEGK